MSGTGGDVLGYNMFAYCFNNPVNHSDSSGNWPKWNDIVTAGKKLFDTVVQTVIFVKVPVISTIVKQLHYNRNACNVAPETEEDAIKAGYILQDENNDKFHQNNQKGEKNKKYISSDGYYEAVYYSDGQLNDTPEDRGTYNVFSSSGGVLERYLGHGIFDVAPYMIWGNRPDDSTTIIDRLIMIFK